MSRLTTMLSLFVVIFAGCAAEPRKQMVVIEPRTTAPPSGSSVADPTADRLHALAGDLLIYYARRQELPPTLEALRAVIPTAGPFVDPATNQPLTYHEPPVDVPGRPGDLLVHAPHRNRQGGYWALLVKASEDKRTLATQVVSLTAGELAGR